MTHPPSGPSTPPPPPGPRTAPARGDIAALLHPKTPARRDPSSAAVGSAFDAIATTGGPVTTSYGTGFPVAATRHAWGRKTW